VEDAFKRIASGQRMAVAELETKMTSQLNELVALVRTDLDKLSRKKVS
jgi:dynein heavy chain